MRIGCAARAQDAGVIASCGYDYLELPGRWAAAQPPSQLRALARHLEALGLPCEALNAYCPPEVVIVGEGFDLAKATEYARRCAGAGAELGVRLVGIGSPLSRKVAPGYDKKAAFSQMSDFFDATAEVFRTYGMMVGIEPLGRCYTCVLNTPQEAREIVESCRADNLGLVVDFYNLKQNGDGDIPLTPFLPFILHAHISGDAGSPLKRWFLPKDAGPELERVRRLLEGGYQGRLSVEVDLPVEEQAARRTLALLRST